MFNNIIQNNLSVNYLRNIYYSLFNKGLIDECFNILNFSLDIYNNIEDYEIKLLFLIKINNLNDIIKFLKENNTKKLPFYLKLEYLSNIKKYNQSINILFNLKEEFRYFCYYCLDIIKNKQLPILKFDLKYETVLIEFRELQHLEFLIRNTILKIGNEWSHTIICGNLNYDYCLRIIGDMNIKVIKLNIDNLDIENYNKLLCSELFWNLFNGDKILIYQEDTFIFKSNIMDFIEWDYIGAPWPLDSNDDKLIVGNGGFSLRTKKIMLEIIKNIPYNHLSNESLNKKAEDIYFSRNINKFGKIANFNSAIKFSSEYFTNEDSFGSHCFFYFNHKWRSLIYNNIRFSY